jgi:hypothetical protein
MNNPLATFTILSVTAFVPLAFGQHPPMPPGMSHEEHMKQMSQDAEMKKRGSVAMGFDQDRVSHHFHLTSTGGIIEVGVNQDTDAETRKQIRDHSAPARPGAKSRTFKLAADIARRPARWSLAGKPRQWPVAPYAWNTRPHP